MRFDGIPVVVGDDEVPFVLHAGPDPRPFATVVDTRLRQSPGGCLVVETPFASAWVTSFVTLTDAAYVMAASLGGLLDPLWDAYAARGVDALGTRERCAAPRLVTALHRKVVATATLDPPVDMRVMPPSAVAPMTMVAVAERAEPRLAAGDLAVLSLLPARGALDLLGDVANLRGEVPTGRSPVGAVNDWLDEWGGLVEEVMGHLGDALKHIGDALPD